jgi:dipicolinate synthase subunit A
MSFDDVAIENSISTSEGIIADIIQNTDYTLNNSNITVLGYGRVGKTLVNKLLKLGANVNVGVIKESDYISLIYENINVFYTTDMKNNLINSNIIINTVPRLLLDKINLNYTKKDVYIIDIASAPYGIDFEYAKDKKIKYTILKGIPGKVAPKTAGTILANKINKILKEAL